MFTEYNALPPAQRGSLAKAVFQYWFRNSAVLEALVQIHRTDILFDSLRRSSGLIEALQPLADDPARFDYFVAIITSAMIGVLTVWVEHGKTETENQMVQKLTSAFIEMAILSCPVEKNRPSAKKGRFSFAAFFTARCVYPLSPRMAAGPDEAMTARRRQPLHELHGRGHLRLHGGRRRTARRAGSRLSPRVKPRRGARCSGVPKFRQT